MNKVFNIEKYRIISKQVWKNIYESAITTFS